MEVGDQGIDQPETVARGDEDIGVAVAGGQRAVRLRGRFQGAQRSRADRDHAAAAGARLAHGLGQFLGDGIPLRMHLVLGQVLGAHRLEGAGTHVQRQEGAAHAGGIQPREQRVIEMQARGRCRHGARIARVDGLVAGLVVGVGVVRDVRRQRQAPVALDQVQRRRGEAQREELVHARADRDREGVFGQVQRAALGGRFRGAHLGQHGMRVQHALHQHLDLAAARLVAEEACLDHARVVEDQQVFRAQVIDDVAEGAVDQAHRIGGVGGRDPFHHQQPAGAAVGQRALGDQFWRQRKIEIGKRQHRGNGARGPRRVGKRGTKRHSPPVVAAGMGTIGESDIVRPRACLPPGRV
ncbi:hypothetical protein FQZ97_659400 [compost metagenome]